MVVRILPMEDLGAAFHVVVVVLRILPMADLPTAALVEQHQAAPAAVARMNPMMVVLAGLHREVAAFHAAEAVVLVAHHTTLPTVARVASAAVAAFQAVAASAAAVPSHVASAAVVACHVVAAALVAAAQPFHVVPEALETEEARSYSEGRAAFRLEVDLAPPDSFHQAGQAPEDPDHALGH